MGDNSVIDEMITVLRSGKEINNWGAKVPFFGDCIFQAHILHLIVPGPRLTSSIYADQVDEVVENATGTPIEDHKVTTENVDSFNWGKAEF